MSRKPAIIREDFLRAVRRLNTLANGPISQFLGVGKTTVWEYKKKNPEVVKEAKDYLASFDEFNVTASKMTWEIFLTMPKIRAWGEAMEARMVSPEKQRAWKRIFFNLCRHLKTVPGKITVDQAAKIVVEQRNRYYADEPQVKGIYYSTVRESVRGFFMSVHNVSGMHLTNLGVGKEALKGSGKFSRQAVPREVRHKFEKILVAKMEATNELKFFEALGNSQFNFATATRISASLAFSFRLHQYRLMKDKWMFEIWDKGSRGKKLRWEKIIMGDLLKTFKGYCSKRFNIPIEELESRLPVEAEYLFPSFIREDGKPNTSAIRDIVKPALIEAGIPYKDFPPTHIWRHTFAQDFLRASNWNYELCASLGGWKNTMILKGHYGAMGERSREVGLLIAMGEEIVEEVHELSW